MNDIYSLIVGGVLAGQPVENVLHFMNNEVNGADPITSAQDLNTQWAATLQDPWLDCHPDNYTLLGTKARRVNQDGGPSLGALAAPGTVGTRPGAASSSAVGPVILAPVNAGGVWITGKIFINGAADDDLDNNVFSAGLLAALGTLGTTLIAALPGGALQWHYVIYRPSTGTGLDVTATGVSVKPGIQNRRLKPHF